jgi:hypothetical protein
MKILKTLIVVLILSLFNSISFAEQTDCSSIDTSTGVGMYEKYRCMKNLPPKEKTSLKSKLKKLNIFKKDK